MNPSPEVHREPTIHPTRPPGPGIPSSPEAVTAVPEKPTSLALYENVPNPFNPSTDIYFHLSVAADVQLRVFNLAGRHVATLIEAPLVAGNHRVQWQGRDKLAGC